MQKLKPRSGSSPESCCAPRPAMQTKIFFNFPFKCLRTFRQLGKVFSVNFSFNFALTTEDLEVNGHNFQVSNEAYEFELNL